MGRCIGIDLGTSNTVAAVCIGQTPTILPNAEGEHSTPSIVGFNPASGDVLVGAAAKRQALLNPTGTIFSVKRLMGATFDQVAEGRRALPYELMPGPGADVHIKIGGRTFSPVDISALILKKVKQDAEGFLHEDITHAVVTVPAYFNDRQRRATKTAAELAGLKVSRMINEPTAAALAYGLSRSTADYTIGVVHLGGGTLDISILTVGDGVFEVLSVYGDTHLGGDDFDRCIIDWAADELRRTYGIEAFGDSTLLEMLKWEAERAKCDLSTTNNTELVLPCMRRAQSERYEKISLSLPRSVFEERTKPLIDRVSRAWGKPLRTDPWAYMARSIASFSQDSRPGCQP